MHSNGSNVVRMCLEARDFLGRVVIVDPNLKVIGTTHNPVLAGNEPTRTNRNIGKLECFDNCLCSERPDVDMPAVQCRQYP